MFVLTDLTTPSLWHILCTKPEGGGTNVSIEKDIADILIGAEELQAKIAELGRQISEDYRGQNPLLICLLRGAVVFLSDLIRAIDIPLEMDFMAISSYGASTESSGVVRLVMDLKSNIMGRNVLIVEDIVDSGRTLAYILDNLQTRRPADIKVCALLSKPSRREVQVELDYLGFEIPDKFVVGYGLDYAEAYRNLPFIGVLKPELYK
ncbi:MAG: hypoxanthine phosphoribosyltransferase [Anaerolineales bacterium]|nr:MAG: hypoxanthine phosphoribosyltransferase [Anaerolineales bacterium]